MTHSANSMYVEILTPEKKFYQGEAHSVVFPGSADKGSFEVLPNHAPLISSLMEGVIRLRTSAGVTELTITGGFVEVLNNKVSVLVESVVG